MKIKELKINGFGKLKDKEINLKDGINIVYGENEAGKSTLLKFISSMFYGLSKNKNGGTIPEVEKYEPWNSEEFSGKITYELDKKEIYEVYRDFKKKNPKIFNENLEDISKNFNIDKTKGNQFFYDQIGLEEEIFTSSIITKQAEVKLDDKMQNTLIQKISNILGTGEETASYTTIVNKLKKKLNDEVGTANTKERPINLVENRIRELSNEKNNLELYKESKFEIDEKINQIAEDIQKKQEELDKLRGANLQKEKLKEEENRISINQEMINNIKEQIEILKNDKRKGNMNKKGSSMKINAVIIVLLIVITTVIEIVTNNTLTHIIFRIIPALFLIYSVIKYLKIRKEYKQTKEKVKTTQQKIQALEENKNSQQIELEKIQKDYENNLLKIKSENNIRDLENILEEIDKIQREISTQTLNLHTIELDNKNVIPKLEKLVNIEEELENLQEEKIELEEKRENIKRTLEYLEIAYHKMKEQVTPKFTEELSKVMEKISNGKYKNVRININGEIIVEQNTGEYVSTENLSIGTIDQLYLSLRLATIKEITKENMPIILDEAFAYYDNSRLENILEYLSKEYANKQIIIFTCTKREKEILEKLQIKHNLIEL